MRFACLFCLTALGCLAVMSCGGGGSIASSDYNPGYGPFDKHGNYVEEWADKPAKKHWWARMGSTAEPGSTDTTTAVAQNTPSSKPPGTVTSSSRSTSRPAPSPTTASRPATKPAAQPTTVATSKPKPATASTPKPAPKPKPKPTPVKPKKPAPIRHVVKRGDTLYGLSRKYGTTVSAIQKANGLKGTTIVDGKTILIPR